MILPTLREYRWPSGIDFWIGSINVRLPLLAERFGLQINSWEEDGLGSAEGSLLVLPSGSVVLLVELGPRIQYHGAPGPDLMADAGEVALRGPDALRTEALALLELTTEAVEALPRKDAQEGARNLVEQIAKARQAREAKK